MNYFSCCDRKSDQISVGVRRIVNFSCISTIDSFELSLTDCYVVPSALINLMQFHRFYTNLFSFIICWFGGVKIMSLFNLKNYSKVGIFDIHFCFHFRRFRGLVSTNVFTSYLLMYCI